MKREKRIPSYNVSDTPSPYAKKLDNITVDYNGSHESYEDTADSIKLGAIKVVRLG